MNSSLLMAAMVYKREMLIAICMSDRDAEIIKYIRDQDSATSATVAKKFNISVPNAAVSMKRLFEVGYLSRSDIGSKSGGKEFLYTLSPTLEKGIEQCAM
jgi:predicted transcriptional regulator